MLQVYKLLVLQEHIHLEFLRLQYLHALHVLLVFTVDQIQLITQEMFVLLGITAQKVVQQRNLLPVLQELFRPQQD